MTRTEPLQSADPSRVSDVIRTSDEIEAVISTEHASATDRAIRYDPEAIAAYYNPRPLQVWARLLTIFGPFLWFALQVWWDRQTGKLKKNEQRRATQLREMLTDLGPAFIKVGQALSTRPDLVPPLYLEELTKLQDQLPPFPNEVAFQFIEEELGDRPERIYAELSPDPLAAASLGQVYRGKLKTGEDVAVKVQRPGLAQRITLDLFILRQLASLATKVVKRVRSDLVGIMDEFGARIFEEMDYAHEAYNAERFAKLYGHLPEIYVPRIYWDYTNRRVLTMEWIDGTKLTNPEAIRAQNIDAAHLIEVGVQCSLRQLLEHGFFHADPHPGNLLATRDGKLAYLDFGMMSEIRPPQRYGLIEAVVHMVNRDFSGLAHDYVNLEFLTPDTDLTPIIPALANVFSNALGASVAEMNFKSITDQLSEVMYDYPFRIPAYYALIIRSLVTLEGIAIHVDPDFKVLSKAYPYIAKRLLTDPAPQLRTSLKELLFQEGTVRWNRLENLLRNAKDSSDYDLNKAIDQAIEFLFSERGEFIREQLVNEIVEGVDGMGQMAVSRVTAVVRDRLGLKNGHAAPVAEQKPQTEHLLRVLTLLRDTPGFDPMQLLPVLPNLLTRPETQEMGQQIASGLAQRAAARFIREFLLPEEVPPATNTVEVRDITPSQSDKQLALPPARR
ncbi:ABC1 kinase family protein [Vacuolonema iberomarrocanum]|uniref:ABC1 kinase family protein n=1 Tax=Vacuolonema iberomarrocanum TaxID=3454632 RepID=UPI0019EF30E9|nr:AarF/ABC1/UbiB kinase family protein [filamentous cyanobacterium LEGE 07170]